MSDYERIERLGAGNFGEVWLVYDRALNVNRAVKYVAPSRIYDPTQFYKEPHVLMELRHDHVVSVEDAGKLKDGTLYIAMEYLPKGSVESTYKGGPLPLSKALRILINVCWGLEYAHNRGVVHRDIKPANILLGDDGRAKLSDFGLATRIPRGGLASPTGYLTHIAPEVFKTGNASKASDTYALGVTAYRLINGDGFLPDVHEHDDIKDMILAGEYPDRTRYRPYVPKLVQRIINACMAIDPNDRYPSASHFRRALEGIILRCDWRLRRIKRNTLYFTRIGNAHIRVLIAKDRDGRFSIETTKQLGSGQQRRTAQDCAHGLTRAAMKKQIRRILPRYVNDGK